MAKVNKNIEDYLKNSVNDLTKNLLPALGTIKNDLEKVVNLALTPEVRKEMTEDQLNAVKIAQRGFKLDGKTPEAKLEELQNTLKSLSNAVKNK